MEVEITSVRNLTKKQKTLLDYHSFLNIFNVLIGELQYLSLVSNKKEILAEAIDLCLKLKDSLSYLNKKKISTENLNFIQEKVLSQTKLLGRNGDKEFLSEIEESVANIKSVFNIMHVRVHELLSREKSLDQWVQISINNLKQNYINLFKALEKNSKGRYRIIYNLAAQKSSDYYIDIKFDSINESFITMPLIMQDVFRDIVANARKYTKPGGRISAGLFEDSDILRMVVEDSGIGIPEDEIENVINYGHRASNVKDLKTMGGGFGLTKAYFTIKRFNGQMWVKSKIGEGTKITIEIPKPVDNLPYEE